MKHQHPLPVCMIGGGVNSAVGRVHEIAMQMDHRFKLVAGCFSRNAEINRQTAVQYGLDASLVFNSAEQLLKSAGHMATAVVIATPIQNHAQHIGLALDHGKTVISDKPLLATVAECEQLMQRIDPLGTDVFSIFNYTGYPAIREMRRRVLKGEFGKLFKIMVEMPQDSYQRLVNLNMPDRVQPWRLKDGEIPCVSLDLFVHLDSLIQFITARRPLDVYARSSSVSGICNGLIDEVDALITYEDQIRVNAWYGKAALGHRNGLSIRIYGSQGSAQWVQENPEQLDLTLANGDRVIIDRISQSSAETTLPRYNRFKAGHPAGFIEAFANYYYDIADAIEAGRLNAYTLSVEQATEGLRLCDAIARSSQTEQPVRLCDLETHA